VSRLDRARGPKFPRQGTRHRDYGPVAPGRARACRRGRGEGGRGPASSRTSASTSRRWASASARARRSARAHTIAAMPPRPSSQGTIEVAPSTKASTEQSPALARARRSPERGHAAPWRRAWSRSISASFRAATRVSSSGVARSASARSRSHVPAGDRTRRSARRCSGAVRRKDESSSARVGVTARLTTESCACASVAAAPASAKVARSSRPSVRTARCRWPARCGRGKAGAARTG